MFGMIRRWRRRRWAREPISPAWIELLKRRVPFYNDLDEAQRERLQLLVVLFIREKHFIAAGGMQLDDEVRVVIAAAATRLILHLDMSYYDRLTEIVVYPSHFHNPQRDDGGAVTFGEAHRWGTVVLSWDAVAHGLRNPQDGHDTATHEFAHVLDVADGSFDGTPELRARADYRAWAVIMSDNFEKLRMRRRPQRQLLRSYGATNEAEFFAVATETFFEKPERMRRDTPELYDELARFYGGTSAVE